jgi:YidC/Oxa1 family membrane protein insertase
MLAPLTHALAAILAAAHAALSGLPLTPGTTWVLSLAAVVVAVRVALLPLVAHGVRTARASARARPQLQALAARYRDRRDRADLAAYAEERRAIAAEHRLSPWGCLPMIAQVPVWIALYHLVSDLAGGTPVGAVGPALAASLGAATLLGVPLASRGYLGLGATHLAVVAGLAGLAALMAFVTQRYLTTAGTDVPEAAARVQQLLPFLSAGGLLVAAGFVPVALLVYWVLSGAWTLGQSAVVRRLADNRAS